VPLGCPFVTLRTLSTYPPWIQSERLHVIRRAVPSRPRSRRKTRRAREHTGCSGPANEVGRHAALLKKIGNAGINLEATDAVAIGGKYAAIFFVDQKDIPKLDWLRALCCKRNLGASPAMNSRSKASRKI
jgi:hypothetical protein